MNCEYRITKAPLGGWVVLLILLALAIPSYAAAETFVVDRLTDTGEGEGLAGDLRYCITNAISGEDVITFEVGGIIALTSALPALTRSISIEGPGASLLTVGPDAVCDPVRIETIFTVVNAPVSISGLTVANACQIGIHNFGTLTLSNATVSGNGGGRYGGGIWNERGTMNIINSIVSGNDGGRGGIDNRGTMTVSNSTISGNSAYGGAVGATGGGIVNWGTGALTIGNSTISGNSAFGGAISNGGGIANGGTLSISNSTISGNGADMAGGGIFATPTGTLSMQNTIVAGNQAHGHADLSGRVDSSGYNLFGDSSGGSGFDETDLLDVNPRLAVLQDNGGPTFTHALLEGSLAIDAADNADAPEWDQRGPGFPRIVNGVIDIGALEVQVASLSRSLATRSSLRGADRAASAGGPQLHPVSRRGMRR